MTTTSPGRRERKKHATRAALELAALRLFAKKGYENTTIEDIAETADVAVRTFFRHFSSKQHVLFDDLDQDINDHFQTALLTRPIDEHVIDTMREVLRGLNLDAPERQRQIRVRMNLIEQQPALRAMFYAVFRQPTEIIAEHAARLCGLSVDDLFPRLLATAATESIQVSLHVWHAKSESASLSLQQLCQQAYDILVT
ncbi:MAG: TetR/AcrR family transcriptional regulator, partial [bacterium]